MKDKLSVSAVPKIVSLFCGAGGLDLGFKEEGFEIAIAIDYEESAISTHKRNFPETYSLAEDLTKIGPVGVLEYTKKCLLFGDRIGIIGGPPCQGFSRANTNSKINDPRNLLPNLYIDIIEELQKYYVVEFVVFENVLGMKDRKHAEKYLALIANFKRLGFTVDEKELCALDFGVPQNRRRIIVSAMRNGKAISQFHSIKRLANKLFAKLLQNLKSLFFMIEILLLLISLYTLIIGQ